MTAPRRLNNRGRRNPWRRTQKVLYVALAVSALAGTAVMAQCGLLHPALPLLYLTLSTLAFILFYVDKKLAVARASRIRETTLHLAELCCGWPGAIMAQVIIRHKNRKLSFQVLTFCSIIANLGLLAVYAYAAHKQ